MKKILFTLLIVFCVQNIFAQAVDDVTLVVSSDGPTKEDATHTALRSAIEQAYGVFVSANTEILNDEIVKDEIATVTSGNVKSYKELSAVLLPNGNHLVSLQVVVSTKKLAAYALSKGVSCEFAGALFGANIKLHELNVKNTEIAFENFIKQVKMYAPYLYDVKLEVGEPYLCNQGVDACIPTYVTMISNINTWEFEQFILSTLLALDIDSDHLSMIRQMGFSYHRIKLGFKEIEKQKVNVWSKEFWSLDENQEYELQFYSEFPGIELRNVLYNALPKYLGIIDNLGGIHKCPIADYLNSNIIRKEYGPDDKSSFYFDDENVILPKIPGPKVKKKEVVFKPLQLGEVRHVISIPKEDVSKITNIELAKMTDIQSELHSIVEEIYNSCFELSYGEFKFKDNFFDPEKRQREFDYITKLPITELDMFQKFIESDNRIIDRYRISKHEIAIAYFNYIIAEWYYTNGMYDEALKFYNNSASWYIFIAHKNKLCLHYLITCYKVGNPVESFKECQEYPMTTNAFMRFYEPSEIKEMMRITEEFIKVFVKENRCPKSIAKIYEAFINVDPKNYKWYEKAAYYYRKAYEKYEANQKYDPMKPYICVTYPCRDRANELLKEGAKYKK